MRQYERNGVTVDQCSECRGIFLDRGELDRLIDAENRWSQQPQQPQQAPRPPQGAYDPRRDPRYGHKKRKHWLEELFD